MSRLLLNGCSFTEAIHTNLSLYYDLGIEVINIAKGSAGNTYISNTTRQYINNNEVDYVFIQWSALIRGYQDESRVDEGTINLTIEEQMKLHMVNLGKVIRGGNMFRFYSEIFP